jgi:hypothetical protein
MCSFEAWFFRTVDVEELLQIETCLHPGRACASFAATRGARHLDQREKNTAEASHLRLTLFHAFSRLSTLLFQPASAGGRAACALSSFKKNDKHVSLHRQELAWCLFRSLEFGSQLRSQLCGEL